MEFTNSLLSEKDTKRFWSKVNMTGDCWLWTASKNGKGRGRFWFGKVSETAPRVAMRTVGINPDGFYVLHTCHNPGCVRPDHLYLDGQSANMKDAVETGTHNMASKTHCPRGHSYDEHGTRNNRGSRRCLQCERDKHKEQKEAGWKRVGTRWVPPEEL